MILKQTLLDSREIILNFNLAWNRLPVRIWRSRHALRSITNEKGTTWNQSTILFAKIEVTRCCLSHSILCHREFTFCYLLLLINYESHSAIDFTHKNKHIYWTMHVRCVCVCVCYLQIKWEHLYACAHQPQNGKLRIPIFFSSFFFVWFINKNRIINKVMRWFGQVHTNSLSLGARFIHVTAKSEVN